MDVYQLPLLPDVSHQNCPLCKQPANVLGQWSPGNRTMICAGCSRRLPAPMHIFDYGYKGRPVTIARDCADHESMSAHVSAEAVLARAKQGCAYTLDDVVYHSANDFELPCQMLDHAPRPDCRACRRRVGDLLHLMHYHRVSEAQARVMLANGVRQQLRYARAVSDAKMRAVIDQLPLPVCKTCGCAHTHTFTDGKTREVCQRCDDEAAVRSLEPLLLLHHGDDDEAALDRLYRAFPELFARGVLPDYWFQRKLASRA